MVLVPVMSSTKTAMLRAGKKQNKNEARFIDLLLKASHLVLKC